MHVHKEAFMIMQYQRQDKTGPIERIWNSQDGVTPFCVAPKEGANSPDDFINHVYWDGDEYHPAHIPKIGDRVFVPITFDRAKAYAEHRIASVSEAYPDSVAPPLLDMIKNRMDDPCPDLVVVDEELRSWFEQAAQQRRDNEKFFRSR